MQVKEKIKKLLHNGFSGQPAWKGFIFWWLAANGYEYEIRSENVSFVDGSSDGGIDAIAWPLEKQGQDDILVLQSKFFGQPPTDNDLRRFVEAVEALNGPYDNFLTWLASCRVELQPIYRRLRSDRRRCRYILIAPCELEAPQRRLLQTSDIEVHDSSVLSKLERNYSEGRTPRLNEFRISDASKPQKIADGDDTKVWIFTAPARELGAAYERHGDILFAGNIRYALRGSTARRVRDGMLATIQRRPDEFVFSHNGITITGDKITKKRDTITMRSATIVNGAQTVSYLGKPDVMKHLTRNSSRLIVKFVEVRDGESLNDIESKVAYRSNNQNKVSPSDLMIDLASLVSLQRYFRRHHVPLERKKGEQKVHFGELSVTKERLTQILAAVESADGAVRGKRKQELFEGSAPDIFAEYDASESTRAEAIAWTRVDDIFRVTIKRFGNKKRRKRAQLAELAALTTFHRAIRMAGQRGAFLRAMAKWETNGASLEYFVSRACKAVIASLLGVSSQDRKNEPAFYKALGTVKPAVEVASRRSKKKVSSYFREYASA